jgi:hypothetical protein
VLPFVFPGLPVLVILSIGTSSGSQQGKTFTHIALQTFRKVLDNSIHKVVAMVGIYPSRFAAGSISQVPVCVNTYKIGQTTSVHLTNGLNRPQLVRYTLASLSDAPFIVAPSIQAPWSCAPSSVAA